MIDRITFTDSERQRYLRLFGAHSLAFSTLQPSLSYIDIPECGYVAYREVGRLLPTRLVLGDPVCARRTLADVLDTTIARLGSPVFISVSRQVATLLSTRGYYANQFGIETRLDLRNWNLTGPKKQKLRAALNAARRAAVCIGETHVQDGNDTSHAIVSREGLDRKTPGGREMEFLTAPIATMNHPDVRTFVATNGAGVMAVAHFTPTYRNGRVTGYMADIIRTRDLAPKNIGYAMKVVAARQFRDEGREGLELGLSPGLRIEDDDDHNSRLTTLLLTTVFQYANRFYSFKGIARSKRYFRGQETHVYLCSRHALPLLAIIRLFQACNIRPLRDAVRTLVPNAQAS